MAPAAVVLNQSISDDSFPWKDNVKADHSAFSPAVSDIERRYPLTIDELIRQRAEDGPDEVIISYPSSGIEYVDYTYRQLDVFAARVARKYKSIIPQRESSLDTETVVGLLGPSNFEYFVSILALTKLGHTVLLLSTRISTAAYISLLQATGARHILIDGTFRDVVGQVKESLPTLQAHGITEKAAFDFPVTESDLDTRFDRNFQPKVESSRISWIIHSSGSTGLPKPIYQTHSAALNNYSSNLNLRGFITLPLYHAHGISSVFRAIHSRKQIYMYNATLPLTQQHLLNIMHRYDFEIFYGVPYALKILGETQEGIAALTKLTVVMFGGSACPDALGDRLVENGVNLVSHYGTTETGQLMTSFREPGDKAWDYVRLSDAIKPYIKFELRNPGIYELVALDGLPSKVASSRPDGSYATKDLFKPHPSIPNAWKYFARLDDTIVLMNGEKVIPTAFEQSVRDNKYVTEAVLFGSGKACVGMMIISSAAAQGLPSEQVKRLLIPVLAKANETVPAYAQLSLDMVRISPAGTEYPRTDKGTVIRAAFYRAFEAQIEEVYEAAEVSCGELCLSEPELRHYIRTELSKILTLNIFRLLQDDTDFFSVGIDSLQAIQLRSVLSKNIQLNGEKLALNAVFDFPSINSLAKELYRLRIGGASTLISTTAKMEELISKYSTFHPHIPVENAKGRHYVVVTGATGSLGAHLVSQLVVRSDVKKVYCLVRARSPSSARLRVIQSMRERSVYHCLPLEARKKLSVFPSDFGKTTLGLEPGVYNEIASEITGVIHCAWSVNFNLGLGSFEADCIAGAHNLIALCLKARRPEPATFNFCSSVSAVAATTEVESVPEALPKSLEYAQDMGYAQSKLVTEHICVRAASSYGVNSRVLRIGQVIADTVHGIWNATEAIPLMMQAGLTIGSIPRLDENPLWLPVDVVASTISDISLSDASPSVVNVVNHKSFHWTRDLLPALHRAGLEFSEPTEREWVGILRQSKPDPVANPPIKLVEFFASKYDNDVARKSLTYDTSLARFLSPALAAAPLLDQRHVDKFVARFQATSWATATPPNPPKRLIVIVGLCGTSKSIVPKAASQEYSIPWVEGDDLHTEAAIAKMSAGIPLSDEDCRLWLETVKATALARLTEEKCSDIIVTCSALQRVHREELRQSRALKTVFIILQGGQGVSKDREAVGGGHFRDTEMVERQLESQETPGVDETDVIPMDGTATGEEVIAEIMDILGDSKA